jgi:2-oxoglutarate dehydrogenase complex dehydrogenase (E1) component-like enzyme
VYCTGKIGHELIARRDELGAPVAIIRVEQLYPIPENEITEALASYPNVEQVWWAQEEPENMGPAAFALPRLRVLARERAEVRWVAREPSASSATGSPKVSDAEHEALLRTVFG